jgi:hypothetical protein
VKVNRVDNISAQGIGSGRLRIDPLGKTIALDGQHRFLTYL